MRNADPNPKATKQVTVTLPSELVQQLDEHAAQERRTRSNALRLLLENALQTRRAG